MEQNNELRCDVCDVVLDELDYELTSQCAKCYDIESWELPEEHPRHEFLVYYHKIADYKHIDVTVKLDDNGLWGYGHWHLNGCGPVHGRWVTREEAEAAGIEHMNKYFTRYKKGEKSCCASAADWRKALNHWTYFYESRNQLSLF